MEYKFFIRKFFLVDNMKKVVVSIVEKNFQRFHSKEALKYIFNLEISQILKKYNCYITSNTHDMQEFNFHYEEDYQKFINDFVDPYRLSEKIIGHNCVLSVSVDTVKDDYFHSA